jgi:hypothetical protein
MPKRYYNTMLADGRYHHDIRNDRTITYKRYEQVQEKETLDFSRVDSRTLVQ